MKKVLCFILASIFTITLVGCTSTKIDTTNSNLEDPIKTFEIDITTLVSAIENEGFVCEMDLNDNAETGESSTFIIVRFPSYNEDDDSTINHFMRLKVRTYDNKIRDIYASADITIGDKNDSICVEKIPIILKRISSVIKPSISKDQIANIDDNDFRIDFENLRISTWYEENIKSIRVYTYFVMLDYIE